MDNFRDQLYMLWKETRSLSTFIIGEKKTSPFTGRSCVCHRERHGLHSFISKRGPQYIALKIKSNLKQYFRVIFFISIEIQLMLVTCYLLLLWKLVLVLTYGYGFTGMGWPCLDIHGQMVPSISHNAQFSQGQSLPRRSSFLLRKALYGGMLTVTVPELLFMELYNHLSQEWNQVSLSQT